MRLLWSTKFILANFFVLALLQIFLVAPGFQLATLLSGDPPFSAQDIISATNSFRKDSGLDSLRENNVLNIAAAQKLQDMALNEYFAHFSPSGVSPWHWFAINNYSYSYAGENLAIGFIDASTTVNAWAQSPSHRKNMSNSNYHEIGVAVRNVEIQGSEGVLVVQLFGTPSTPSQISGAVSTKPSPSSRVSVGISRGSAQEPTPVITPTPKKETPVPIARVQEEIKPPASPTPVQVTNTPRRIITSAFTRTFAVYSLSLALAAVIYLMVVEIRRELFAKAMAYAVLALISFFTVPAISSLAYIF